MVYQKELKFRRNKKGCWICVSHAKDKDSYVVFRRNKKWYRVHRYMYEQKYGVLEHSEFIGHKCKNSDCINPKHLFKSDMKGIIKNSNNKNPNRKRGKLTKKEIIEIFKDRITPQKDLAKKYGVKKNAIGSILNGLTWKHITSKIKLIQTPKWLKKYKEKRKSEYDKNYRKNNKKEIKGRIRKWKLMKYKTDKNFSLSKKLKWNFWNALNKYTKTGKIYPSKQYGVSNKAIIKYLEPIPKDYLISRNKYHIHHIKPLHTFNFVNKDGTTNLKEIKKAFAPENHILLTKEEHKEIHRKLNQKRKNGNKN